MSQVQRGRRHAVQGQVSEAILLSSACIRDAVCRSSRITYICAYYCTARHGSAAHHYRFSIALEDVKFYVKDPAKRTEKRKEIAKVIANPTRASRL